jgi:hypothetical protein
MRAVGSLYRRHFWRITMAWRQLGINCCRWAHSPIKRGNAIQIFGGSEYILGCEVEWLYLDAKIAPIHGANQIWRAIIARRLPQE